MPTRGNLNTGVNLKGSGKLIDKMANVSIFSGNFFHFIETKKICLSNDGEQFLGKNLGGNNYD